MESGLRVGEADAESIRALGCLSMFMMGENVF